MKEEKSLEELRLMEVFSLAEKRIADFIIALRKGHVGLFGLTPKLSMLVEHFDEYSDRIGNDNTWLEIYGELADIIETILIDKYPEMDLLKNLPTNDPTKIKGKMNDDGTWNPPYYPWGDKKL